MVLMVKENNIFPLDTGEQLSLSLALAFVSFLLRVTIRVSQEPSNSGKTSIL